LDERVVFVNRCAKVVKGGRRFSFSAVVVVGNRSGMVGFGFGKANEAPDAIRKGSEIARRGMFRVTMRDRTSPHEVIGRFGGGQVLLKAASPGTGVIAGGGARAVLEVAGVRDVLAKSLGSKNKLNVVKATLNALEQLRSRDDILATRQTAGA
jgi:small subunit ribosomal protein S5